MQKKPSVRKFFDDNARKFLQFGKTFVANLNDEELINELARKDLEKLAKVFKLVFEMLDENTSEISSEKAAELIASFSALKVDDDEVDE